MAAELHAFFDKDVFLKLASCDLWDDALEALGVTHRHLTGGATCPTFHPARQLQAPFIQPSRSTGPPPAVMKCTQNACFYKTQQVAVKLRA